MAFRTWNGKVNWNQRISPGPYEIGFDYSFLIPATGDRVPCVFIENQEVVGRSLSDPIKVSYGTRIDGYPVGKEQPALLKQLPDHGHSHSVINGISRIGYMSGGHNALWVDENFPFDLTNKAKAFVTANKEKPFFLYFSFHDIHVPRLPNPKFEGISSMGPRGDAIAQMDWCVGQLIKHLENLGLASNTLIVFSSDNGPILNDGYEDQAVELLGEHKPAGPFRGSKYSILEAGTRMPTIVYWPGTVKAGVNSALVSQVDLFASFAKLVGQEISAGNAPDSQDHLDAWLGRSEKGREFLIEEAHTLALRMGNWKYISPKSDGIPDWLIKKEIESGLSESVQLYNLETDIKEAQNLARQNPHIVYQMAEVLDRIIHQSAEISTGE